MFNNKEVLSILYIKVPHITLFWEKSIFLWGEKRFSFVGGMFPSGKKFQHHLLSVCKAPLTLGYPRLSVLEAQVHLYFTSQTNFPFPRQ